MSRSSSALLASLLVCLAAASPASAQRPALKATIRNDTSYTLTAPAALKVPSRDIADLELQVGRFKRSIWGHAVTHQLSPQDPGVRLPRPPRVVKARFESRDRNAQGGTTYGDTRTVTRDRFVLPAAAHEVAGVYRGATGAFLFVRPVFHAFFEPVGIPVEQIAEVVYSWATVDQVTTRTSPAGRPATMADFRLALYNREAALPMQATVTTKDGRSFELTTVAARKARR